MAIPFLKELRIGGYLIKQKLRGRKRYPLVLMLEPLFRCNLACAGCGKIDYPDAILNRRMSVQEQLAVEVPGGRIAAWRTGRGAPALLLHGGPGLSDYTADLADELGERFTGPKGEVIHAEIRIGDSVVMISEEGDDGMPAGSPESPGGVVTAIMATYWEDVDAAWQRATVAGAEVVYPLEDQFYGERGGRLRDPFGQQWMMSQRIERLSHDEMSRRAANFFTSS